MCPRLWLTVLLFVTGANLASAKDWPVIRLATEGNYAPFSRTAADGSLYGLDIDIGNAICAELQVKCVWIRESWDGIIPGLIARKFDAILASMSITAERKTKVDFTDKYYASPLALIAKRGSSLAPVPAALATKRVGVARGTVSDHYATRFWAPQGVEVIRYTRQDEAYIDLAAGRVDATVADYWEAVGGFLRSAEGKKFAVMGEKIYGKTREERAVIGEGIGIAVRKQDQDLKQMLNRGIAAIRKNGAYDRIVRKYFAEDIYGP